MPVLLSGNSLRKPITDATALPEDVTNGKVFYNNNGRQVGEFERLLDIKSMNLAASNADNDLEFRYSTSVIYEFRPGWTSAGGYIASYSSTVTTSYGYSISNVEGIIGLRINGVYYSCPSANVNVNEYTYYKTKNYSITLLYYHYGNKAIYVTNRGSEPEEVIVYYYV